MYSAWLYLISIAALLIFSYVPNVVKQALKYVGPTIEERLLKEKQLGQDWQGKPVGHRHSSISYILAYLLYSRMILSPG